MRIVTFGEVMLRLATPGHLRFNQTKQLEMTFGGGEANVAVSLAQWGHDAAFVTRLPKNDIAEACIQELRGLGVDTRAIVRGGERMGIYFLESGASQRASTVTYDRAGSSISTVNPAELDWPSILAGAKWFHVTGITPALSDQAAKATFEAAGTARKLGVTVSCDLNYRKKLWSPAKAQEVMSGLMAAVDYCIANEEDAEKVFGIKAAESDISQGKLEKDRYVDVAAQLTERFGFKGVAITLRESFSASRNGWSGLYYHGESALLQPPLRHRHRRPRRRRRRVRRRFHPRPGLGPGSPEVIEFAAAASCLKHSIVGDYNRVSLSEVEALLKGDGSGRVQR